MDFMYGLLNQMLEGAIFVFELIGLIVIAVAGVRGAVNYVQRDAFTRLKLAKGFALGLEFKLGSEILRTVLVRELSELIIVGSIILLRAALTFLINWEIQGEEHNFEFWEHVNKIEEHIQEIGEQIHHIELHEHELDEHVHDLTSREYEHKAQFLMPEDNGRRVS